MKKYQEIKSIYDIFVDSVNNLDSKLQEQIKKIKQEQNNLIIEEKIKLLKLICEGENLDYNTIKYKYIKPKDISKVGDPFQYENIKTSCEDENILIKTTLNNNIYYYEPKDEGNVYDIKSNIVGVFKNNTIELI